MSKKTDFDCADNQIALLKDSIKRYHMQNKSFDALPTCPSYKQCEDYFGRVQAAMKEVQAAFWACTASYNTLSHCKLIKDIKTFENFVASYESAI